VLDRYSEDVYCTCNLRHRLLRSRCCMLIARRSPDSSRTSRPRTSSATRSTSRRTRAGSIAVTSLSSPFLRAVTTATVAVKSVLEVVGPAVPAAVQMYADGFVGIDARNTLQQSQSQREIRRARSPVRSRPFLSPRCRGDLLVKFATRAHLACVRARVLEELQTCY
jgi:hypothetical protein